MRFPQRSARGAGGFVVRIGAAPRPGHSQGSHGPLGRSMSLKSAAWRVLIVEAQSAGRAAYREILAGAPGTLDSTFDCTVCTEALGALEAMRLARAAGKPYACAFVDLHLARADGVSAVTLLRAQDADLEIIVRASLADFDLAATPAEKIFYLQSPCHPHELRQVARILSQKWQAHRRLRHQAFIDPLTGAPNQGWFKEKLANAVRRAQAKHQSVTLLSLDLDNFRRINDTLGHGAGDELLREMARRLAALAKAESAADTTQVAFARLGGDEFSLIVTGTQAQWCVSEIAERVLESLMQPLNLRGHDILMAPSMGTATYPLDANDADHLRRAADLAMYEAKKQGPGRIVAYTASMNATAARRLALEGQLRQALKRGEFSLAYQPQVNLNNGETAGLEALLRWNNHKLGVVAPLDFIPVAEEMGLMGELGDWVLRTACTQAQVWRASGLFTGLMAVNVSCMQLTEASFPSRVRKILKATGFPAPCLELEITESLAMRDEAAMDKIFAGLKSLDLKLSIDDFGTGYSSFARLQQLPIDRVKIDRSFVAGIAERASDRVVIQAIIKMTQTLGLEVIAEGVETGHQLRRLLESGCDQAQGYLLSRPMDGAGTQAYLTQALHTSEAGRTSTQLHALSAA
jgi:diguanylate cyclase